MAPIVWAIALRLDPGAFQGTRDEVMQAMANDGIETRPGFYPASAMPHLYACGPIPGSEAVAQSVISLPSHPTLTDADIDTIVASLARCAR